MAGGSQLEEFQWEFLVRRAGELHLLVENGADHSAAVGVGIVH